MERNITKSECHRQSMTPLQSSGCFFDRVAFKRQHTLRSSITRRRSSLSQHVTELAQRVDFSEVAEGKEGEPAVKKAIQKWPWEQPHSKLKLVTYLKMYVNFYSY